MAEINKEQVETWGDFLQDTERGGSYYDEILKLADLYPDERTLLVDYWDLAKYNLEFAERFLEQPRKMLPSVEKAIHNLCPEDTKAPLHFRLQKIPGDSARIALPDLRQHHLERFIAIECLVQARSEVRPRIINAAFKCQKCAQMMRIPQAEAALVEPYICVSCERQANKTSFELVKSESSYVDLQILHIQELPEKVRGSAPPQTLKIFLKDDLCGIIAPGERIIVNGILFASQRKIKDSKSTDFDFFLEANSIEMEGTPFEEIQIDEEEKKQILALSNNSLIYDLIRDSIAPNIYEMDYIKEALSLQLFGGITISTPNIYLRGDIHILLLGDPGTGKSQLLRSIINIAPRGFFASGKSASAAGLTATVERDEYDGRWTLVGGALVLADKGMAAIDELDKMTDRDTSAMHEAMEQQSISFAKASITATLMTRCSMLAAANPKKGRFTHDSLYIEQINLKPTLLSRFDLIFPIVDKPNKESDGRLAKQILTGHRAGQMRRNIEEAADPGHTIEEAEQIMTSKPPIEKLLLQKYIAYAKRYIFPVMTPAVKEFLLKYYVEQRDMGKSRGHDPHEVDRIVITPRQLEGLIRLSAASARLRLSNEITKADCQRAMRLFHHYMTLIAQDETGQLDIDTIMAGTTARKRQYREILRQIILDINANPDVDTAKGVYINHIIEEASKREIDRSAVEKIMAEFVDRGQVFSPVDINHFKWIDRG